MKLAVIIPFYKIKYLQETLSSLVNQTNKDFNVYIGDDCAPYSPIETIKPFEKYLNITYTRFNENVGRYCPVYNWNRCLDHLNNEEWVCVLPDDDTLSCNVIEEIYNVINNSHKKYNVLKLGVNIINDSGILISSKAGKGSMSSLQLYNKVLNGTLDMTLGDLVFRKSKLIEIGGFVDFPSAWGSDHATFMLASSNLEVFNIPNAYLNFRMSGLNISSQNDDGTKKLTAKVMFVNWIKKNPHLFKEDLNIEFFNKLYFKGEYYFIYHWSINIKMILKLYELASICKLHFPFFKALGATAKKFCFYLTNYPLQSRNIN